MKPTAKYGGESVMVWVSFSASGPGVVYCIDGIMDQHMYVNTLKESLLLCKQKLCLGDNFYFYQDNHPKNKAYMVTL